MEKVKQVIVMRTDLGMNVGKLAAQSGHASMLFLRDFLTQDTRDLTEEEGAWIDTDYTKIVLEAKTLDQLMKVAQKATEADLNVYTVYDNGTTVFNGVKTLTCISIGPHEESRLKPVTKRLQLLNTFVLEENKVQSS